MSFLQAALSFVISFVAGVSVDAVFPGAESEVLIELPDETIQVRGRNIKLKVYRKR